MPRRLEVSEIHELLRGRWKDILVQLGVPPEHLTGKQTPCPACGGDDRFCFDDRTKRGDYICRQCGAGDGFSLLQKIHFWTFKRTINEVCEAARVETYTRAPPVERLPQEQVVEPASPTQRVRELLRSSTVPENVPGVVSYLQSRGC